MRTASRFVIFAAVIVALACLPAMARSTPNPPKAAEGQVYDRNDIWKGVEDRITALPAPLGGGAEQTPLAASFGKEAGPVAAIRGGSSTRLDSGSMGAGAIPGASGGAILTPMQRAEQQIKKAIRQLG